MGLKSTLIRPFCKAFFGRICSRKNGQIMIFCKNIMNVGIDKYQNQSSNKKIGLSCLASLGVCGLGVCGLGVCGLGVCGLGVG